MPKVRTSNTSRINSYISEFGENIFSSDGNILFCKICEAKVTCEKRFTVLQHLKTSKHSRGIQRLGDQQQKTQQLLPTTSKINSFNKDLCKTLLAANIPLNKLQNTYFRSFLEKYTHKDIPSVSLLRSTYVNECYNETMDAIRKEVLDKKIWISIDETTDVQSRYIANVIIGILNADEPGKIFLIFSGILEKTNHSTICQIVDKALFTLWPNGIRHPDVLLFLSDAAPYMVKAANCLQAFYPKMVHVTCVAHGLHRVAEKIRGQFPKIDELVSNTKKIFLKAPSRIDLFKTEAPGIPLPPTPILTRWGTWISASMYYCEHIEAIRNVIQKLNPEDAVSIDKVQKLISQDQVEANLTFIYSNYGFLPTTITSLESQNVLLADSIKLIETARSKICEVSGTNGTDINKKCEDVFKKNNGFHILTKISKVLSGEVSTLEGIPENLTSNDLLHYKYAPITSVDVERSFSRYKNLLTDNRRSMLFENLYKSLIVQCNNIG